MKKLFLLVVFAFAMLAGIKQSKAQWTSNATVIYPSDTSKNISIGTKSNLTDFYLYRNNAAASLTVRSGNGNATISADKKSSTGNAAINYKVNNASKWNAGMIGNNNYSIKNVTSATVPVVITATDNVGIGTTTPAYKLDVNGDASFNGVRVGRGGGAISSNTALGNGALANNINSYDNTACGYQTLSGNNNGFSNSAFGMQALQNNNGNLNTAMGGYSLSANTTGGENAAFGSESLYSNITGSYNTALGTEALQYNIEGNDNTATGYHALFNNSASNNTAIGSNALQSNTTGFANTATGYFALANNVYGIENIADGYQALYNNQFGSENVSIGFQSLFNNIDGFKNVAMGNIALSNNISGAYNTAVGYNTGPNAGTLYNTTCIGIDATATASDMVRIGNAFVGSIGGQVGWTTISDGRFKENIKDNVPGLDFINKLQPITYNVDRKKINEFTGVKGIGETPIAGYNPSQISQTTTGFIAQDVEFAAKSIGYDFSGVDKPKNDKDFYGLRYDEFVVPLVKAVQELNAKNVSMEKQNAEILSQLNEMRQCVESLCEYSALKSGSTTALAESNMLFQNQPNPVNQVTVIRYVLSTEHSFGAIVIRDLDGNLIKSITLNHTGKGQVTINANELLQGTYTYTLETAGESIDTKIMVIVK